MSLFRKPKKTIQRRVFTKNDEEDEPMDVEEGPFESKQKKNDSKAKNLSKKQMTLLSFETEEEGEVFQVKKSSHSKKMMRLYEKEKEKEKKKKEAKSEKIETKSSDKKEIVTDDLVVVVNTNTKPKTPPPPILSGRDALCAGKDDLSSEEDEPVTQGHRFTKPDNFKKVLESGVIPDAAMIHAARKRRQLAREMGGDYIPVEEQESEDKGRLIRDDENDGSDEERIDMGANPTKRDQELRREQFYEAQDSDQEVNEWEDQQIRKGVTGASLPQELACFEYQLNVQQMSVQAPPPLIVKMDPGVPRTPEAILGKLKQQYESVLESRESNEKLLKQTQEDIVNTTKELEELKMKAPIAAERFRWVKISWLHCIFFGLHSFLFLVLFQLVKVSNYIIKLINFS